MAKKRSRTAATQPDNTRAAAPTTDLGYAVKLWQAADKLRGQVDAAEYKHVVLGLLFLKYISDAFESRREALRAELVKDKILEDRLAPLLENPDEYTAERVDEVADINRDNVKPGSIKGDIEYVDISAVTKGTLGETQWVDFTAAPGRARRRVRHGDTIWSCVRPNRMSYLYIADPHDGMIVSTGFAVLSPRKIGPNFLYLLSTQPEFVEYLVANASGSAYPAVRGDHFERATFRCPPDPLLSIFEETVDPMRRWIDAAERESRHLAALRDYLLPRLLSSEVRVDLMARSLRTNRCV